MTEPAAAAPPTIRHAGRFEWERVIRRARLGFYRDRDTYWIRHSTAQHIGLVLATYADLDGTRMFPSAGRVARVAGVDERTVRACIAYFERLHLLELVAPARSPGRRGGPGRPAEYRMSLSYELLDLVQHLDPDEQHLITPPGAATPPERKRKPKKGDAAVWTAGQLPQE